MRRSIVIGLLAGIGALVVLDAVAARVGLTPGVLSRLPGMDGMGPWITSRAGGVTAFIALTLDVLFGLVVSTGIGDRVLPRARSVEVHRWLSSVALGLTAMHALALTSDRFMRFDILDTLVPFLSPYRAVAVGLGVLAAWGALVLHVSFELRGRIGARAWRKLHALSFAVFVMVLVHGVLAGSDSRLIGMQALYIITGGLVALLCLYRAVFARRGAPAAARSVRRPIRA